MIRLYYQDVYKRQGIARALVNNLMGGDLEGASTITQQLVRNTILVSEMDSISLERKVREAYLSIKMEAVSYTHLDVYKRQVQVRRASVGQLRLEAFGKPSASGLGRPHQSGKVALMSLASEQSLESVSYTHLARSHQLCKGVQVGTFFLVQPAAGKPYHAIGQIGDGASVYPGTIAALHERVLCRLDVGAAHVGEQGVQGVQVPCIVEQPLDERRVADDIGDGPVSYTHLDVYKRQPGSISGSRARATGNRIARKGPP